MSLIQAWKRSGALHTLAQAFLPDGYPDCVTEDYLGFQFWDSIQALSSYIRGMLSGQAIMKGVGVGEKSATPLGAVFHFFVRDLTGLFGGILFAHSQGTGFDSCAKQWRLFADVTNDIGMAVELASPWFPKLFLLFCCFGSVARAVTGVAGGATRAALTQHFAKKGNAADVASKEQSQEAATTLVGMVLGMAVTHATSENPLLAWLFFLLLTWVHVVANVRAVRCLVLHSLNSLRLDVLVSHTLRDAVAPPPADLARIEPLTPPPLTRLWQRLPLTKQPQGHVATTWGARIKALGATPAQLASCLTLVPPSSSYLLKVDSAAPGKTRVLVVVRRGAAPQQLLQAYVHSRVLAAFVAGAPVAAHWTATTDPPHKVTGSPEAQALTWMNTHYEAFLGLLEAAGWHCSRVTLPSPAWTATWGPHMHDE